MYYSASIIFKNGQTLNYPLIYSHSVYDGSVLLLHMSEKSLVKEIGIPLKRVLYYTITGLSHEEVLEISPNLSSALEREKIKDEELPF